MISTQSQSSSIQSKQSIEVQKHIKIKFQASDRNIVIFWLMGLFPPSKTISLDLKQRLIEGIEQQCKSLKENIEEFIQKNKQSSVSQELSFNQKLYLQKMCECKFFDKRQILEAIKQILKIYKLQKIISIQTDIKKKNHFYLINVPIMNHQQMKDTLQILIRDNVEPHRKMIKNKEKISTFFSRKIRLENDESSIPKQNNNQVKQSQQSQQQLSESNSDESNQPTFYSAIYKHLKVQKKQKLALPKNESYLVQIQPRIKEIIFEKDIQFDDELLEEIKKSIRKSKYLELRDFQFSPNCMKRITNIKLDNSGKVQAKLKQVDQLFSYRMLVVLNHLTTDSINKIKDKFKSKQLSSYKCYFIHGFVKPGTTKTEFMSLMCDKVSLQKSQSAIEEYNAVQIIGARFKVIKIEKEITKLSQSLPKRELIRKFKIKTIAFQPYVNNNVKFQNMIKQQVFNCLNQPEFKYIEKIFETDFQGEFMEISVALSSQEYSNKYEQKSQMMLNLLHKTKYIHETLCKTDQISDVMKEQYLLLPNVQDQSKLILISTQENFSKKLIEILTRQNLQNQNIKEKLQFNKAHHVFIRPIVEQYASFKQIKAEIEDNTIILIGKSVCVKESLKIIQKQIEGFKSEVKSFSVKLSRIEINFIRNSCKQLQKQLSQKYLVGIEVHQDKVELLYLSQPDYKNVVQQIKQELQKRMIHKTIKIKNRGLFSKQTLQFSNVEIKKNEVTEQFQLFAYNKQELLNVIQIIEELNKKIPTENLSYPQFWQPQNNDVAIYKVQQKSDQFKKIQDQFSIGNKRNFQIKKISRIQNKLVFKTFIQEKKCLELLKKQSIKSQFLYHGTGKTNPEIIFNDKEQCFNVNYSGENNFLGTGIYFAVKSEYSQRYSYKQTLGNYQMLLCEVLTGDSQKLKVTNETRTMNDTNYKNPENRIRYESATTYTQGSDIYAVYKNRRAYPHYLIEYQK